MALRNVVKMGEETLRKKCKKVEKFDENLWVLLEDMFETMNKNNGMGLAAPQVGILKQIVVMEVNGAKFEMINPEIIEQSQETIDDEEGCLSVPGVYETIQRPAKVSVQAYNENGKMFTLDAEGLLARIIQHEYDHLEGMLFIDRGDPEVAQKTVEQFKKRAEKAEKRAAEKEAKARKIAAKKAAAEAKKAAKKA